MAKMNSQDKRKFILAPIEKDLQGLLDNHFHLHSLKMRGVDPRPIIEDLFSRGWVGGVDAGADLEYDEERYELIKPYFPHIRMAVGLNPPKATGDLEAQLAELKDHMTRFDAVAIGEIGLDFFWDCGSLKQQTALLLGQFDIARDAGLPVIIHTRDADREMEHILRTTPPAGGVMHCFSGDWELAEAALEAGMYISFSGNLCFKPNDALREVAKRVPLDRIVVETDTPFLTPPPARGQLNHPGMAIWPARMLAELHQVDEETMLKITRENAQRLFGL